MKTTQRLAISRRKRATYYLTRYGLTLDAFEAYLVDQLYRCAVPTCDTELTDTTHKCVWETESGIEGIVCRPCLTRVDQPHRWTRRNREYGQRQLTPRVTAEPPTV